MKIVTEKAKTDGGDVSKAPHGYMRLYNKIDGSVVDVHAIDGKDYLLKFPHLWSLTPIAAAKIVSKEQIVAVDAVIVSEPAKEEVKAEIEKSVEVAQTSSAFEKKSISARSRKLAKFD